MEAETDRDMVNLRWVVRTYYLATQPTRYLDGIHAVIPKNVCPGPREALSMYRRSLRGMLGAVG